MSTVWTKSELIKACRDLTNGSVYNDKVGHSYWETAFGKPVDPGQRSCGICTNGARLLATEFGGKVYGYEVAGHESRKLIGWMSYGHDFAVIGDYIVDWWAWDYERAIICPVITKAYGVKSGKYKPVRFWKDMS